jgi:hypothetical protein
MNTATDVCLVLINAYAGEGADRPGLRGMACILSLAFA